MMDINILRIMNVGLENQSTGRCNYDQYIIVYTRELLYKMPNFT